MEQQPQGSREGVEITREVFDGLEFTRQSRLTNMLDRPTILQLAREWGFDSTADWMESVDIRTYGERIFKGPIVIDDEPIDEIEE